MTTTYIDTACPPLPPVMPPTPRPLGVWRALGWTASQSTVTTIAVHALNNLLAGVGIAVTALGGMN